MIQKTSSRGPDLNNDVCVDNVGNRFDLVLVAAARARELMKQHANSGKQTMSNAPVSALMEIQEGKIGRDYLKRVR